MGSAQARRVAEDALPADMSSAEACPMMRGIVWRWLAAGGEEESFAGSIG